MGDSMRKMLVLALAAIAAGVATTTNTVSADPPDRIPAAGLVQFVAPTPCGDFFFNIFDSQRGAVRINSSGEPVLHFTGGVRATVTAVADPSKSMSFNLPGQSKFLPSGDVVGSGQWLLFGPTVFAYATGAIRVPGGDVASATSTGRWVNLCPILG